MTCLTPTNIPQGRGCRGSAQQPCERGMEKPRLRNPTPSSPVPLRHARRLQTYPKAGDVEAAQGSHRKEGGEERAGHAGGPAYHLVRNPKPSSPAPIRHARRLQTYPRPGMSRQRTAALREKGGETPPTQSHALVPRSSATRPAPTDIPQGRGCRGST
jgi:hypothetical protein